MADTTYYAIGDVHGMAKNLATLHAMIHADHKAVGGKATVIHLGDYVDRGPDSRQVVELAMTLERQAEKSKNLSVHSLLGNHEQMLLDAYNGVHDTAEDHWLMNGGSDALKSYARTGAGRPEDWRTSIDPHHAEWLATLPTMLVDEARKLVFVHAGIDPLTYPECKDEIRIWTRSPRFFNPDKWPDRPELEGLRVIHGHTPTPDFAPYSDHRRVNVDTGCVYGGPLTCAVLEVNKPVRFLQV